MVRPSFERKKPVTGDVPRVSCTARFSIPSRSMRGGATLAAAAPASPPPPRPPRPPAADAWPRTRSRTSGSFGSSASLASDTANSWLTAPSRLEVKTTVLPSGVRAPEDSPAGLAVTLYSFFAAMS